MIKVHYIIWGSIGNGFFMASGVPRKGDTVYITESDAYTVKTDAVWEIDRGIYQPFIEIS